MPRKQSPETQLRHLKRQVKNLNDTLASRSIYIAKILGELDERRRIGAMLSNICYNGKARTDMADDFRRSMTDAQLAWDGIKKI